MTEPKKGDADDPFKGYLIGSMADWVRGKELEDLMMVELDNEQLLPETLYRWDFGKRQLIEAKVLVKVPSTLDSARGRIDALAALAALAKRDVSNFTPDDAVKLFGQPRWVQAERLYLYARLLRRRDRPKQQYMLAELLDECHPPQALEELDIRAAEKFRLLDRRLKVEELGDSEGMFWALVEAIAKRRNLGPLAVFAGLDLDSFVTFMADQLATFRTKLSSLESSSSSTPSD